MSFVLSYQLAIGLFATGLIAGAIDAIAGGGGMICLPVLLGIGVPPHLALGTNKLQSSIGTFMAAWSYYRAKLFNFQTIYKGLIFGFLGAVLGSVAAQSISSHVLQQAIPFMLLTIFVYTLLSPRLGVEDRKPIWSEFYFYIIFGFGLGFYDGFFGPGTGSFWVFALVFFLGYSLPQATAYTKVFNLKSNIIAATCFAIGHNIDYRIAGCMAVGQLFGGQLGAYLAIRNGAKLIRPIFILMVSVTILSLFYKNYEQAKYVSVEFARQHWMAMLSAFSLIGMSVLYFILRKRMKRSY